MESPKPDDLESLNHVMSARLEKLGRIRSLGWEPYPTTCERTDSIHPLLEDWDNNLSNQPEKTYRIAGRLTSMRVMGKAAFTHLQDETGKIQLYFKKDQIGDTHWELFKLLDIGDIISVSGTPFVTKTGEKSLHISEFSLLTKSLRPLPAIKE